MLFVGSDDDLWHLLATPNSVITISVILKEITSTFFIHSLAYSCGFLPFFVSLLGKPALFPPRPHKNIT